MEAERQKVLVVDDDPPIRRLVRLVLTRSGFVVDEADDGAEAIDRLESDGYGAVVLDLMMPRVSGLDVIDWLRRRDPDRLECVIVVTAASEQDLRDLDRSSIQEVIRKPFDLTSIIKAVKRCVERRPPPTEPVPITPAPGSSN